MNSNSPESVFQIENSVLSPPIFVVGYMHSGTTLILNILGNHPEIFSIKGETKYFDLLPIIRQTYYDLEDDEVLRNFVLFVRFIIFHGLSLTNFDNTFHTEGIGMSEKEICEILHNINYHRDHNIIFPLLSNYFTYKSGKSRWLEKSPSHIYHIDYILRYIPHAQFIEIVRDPRAVLASKKFRRASVWSERYSQTIRPFKHLEKAYDPFWDTLSWKSAIQSGRKSDIAFGESILTIRYEDLVTQQENNIRKVCNFLNLSFHPDMLSISTNNTAYWLDGNIEGITTQFINRWKNTLNHVEINIAQLLSQQEMQLFDYPIIQTSIVSKISIPFYLIRSLFEFFVRLFRRFKMGGFSFLYNVIINYLKRFIKLVSRPA